MKKQSKKLVTVFVTGANGLIGRTTVEYLLGQGYLVRALIRQPNTWFDSDSHLEVVIGDVTDAAKMMKFLTGMDICVHLAAAKADEPNSYEVNVIGTKNIVRACQKHKVEFLVNVSTLATKIENQGVYASSKLAADEVVKKGSLPYVILRPGVVYGNIYEGVFGSLLKFAKLPVIPMIGDGTQLNYPIHVEDIAIIIEKVIRLQKKCQGKTFDVGGPTTLTLQELIHIIETKVLKKKPGLVLHIPVSIGMLMARSLRKIMKKPPITVSNILGSTQNIEISRAELSKAIGFKPRSLSKGLENIALPTKEEIEVRKLWKYVAVKVTPTQKDVRDVLTLFKKNKLAASQVSWLSLYIFDVWTKLFSKNSQLQKKLLIVTAIYETSPISAKKLLPTDRYAKNI